MLRRGQAQRRRAGLAGRVEPRGRPGRAVAVPATTRSTRSPSPISCATSPIRSHARELARVVKPGATVASLEFLVPPNRFWRAWWWLYTRFVLPAGRLADRRARVVRSRPVPRAEHLRHYRATRCRGTSSVGEGRLRRRRGADHEPRRRPRDVGDRSRWLSAIVALRSTPARAGGGATGGRCCTRRTRRGTSPTSSSARRSRLTSM